MQIAVKRREVKSKGEKLRYTHLNAEFQRIARRAKKAFLRDQCKEIEEDNQMGKTRELFEKIRDTEGTFPTMAVLSDSMGMSLSKVRELVKDREALWAAAHGVAENRTG